jgi:hypothetical protein
MSRLNSTSRFSAALLLVALLVVTSAPSKGHAQCLDYSTFTGDPVTAFLSLSPDGSINDLTVEGDILWAARTFYGALVSIDISNPDQPAIMGTEQVTVMDEAFFVVVGGTHAYVSYVQWGGDSAIRIFDISDPYQPLDVGNLSGPDFGLVLGMEIRGDRLYVATSTYGGTGLAIVDVSTPAMPRIVGEIALQGSERVDVTGSYALVCNNSWDPYVVDISDPGNPVWVAYLNTSGGGKDLTIVGDMAYVATGSALDIVAVNDPVNSQLVGTIDLPDLVYHVSVTGNLAYVSCRDNGVQIVDVSDPANPVLYSVIDIPGFSYTAIPSGDRIFSAVSGIGLYVAPTQCALGLTAVGQIPASLTLSLQTTPNPFNPRTVLSFELQTSSVVNLDIFDVSGHLVRTLIAGDFLQANQHQQVWNGRDNSGREVGSGVYYARLRAGDFGESLPLTLLR